MYAIFEANYVSKYYSDDESILSLKVLNMKKYICNNLQCKCTGYTKIVKESLNFIETLIKQF